MIVNRQTLVLTVLTFLSTSLSLLFWFFWRKYLNVASWPTAICTGLFGILMLSFWSLFAFLNNRKGLIFLFSFLISLPVLFFYGFGTYPFLSFFVVLISALNLILRVIVAKNALIKSSFSASLNGMSSSLVLLSLSLSLIYLPAAQKNMENFKLEIPAEIFTKIYQTTLKNLASPNDNQLNSFKQTALRDFENQIPSIRAQLISQGFVDGNEIETQVNRARQEYLKQLEENLKNPQQAAGLDEKSIKATVENQINTFISSNQKTIPYLLAASLFFTLNFFSFFFSALVATAAGFLLWLMIKCGLAKKYKETVEAEKISLL